MLYVHRDRRDSWGWGAQDGHLHFHTAPQLCSVPFSVALRPHRPYRLFCRDGEPRMATHSHLDFHKINMVLNVHRNHKLGLLGTGRMGEGGVEVGEEGDYFTYRYNVTTRMTSALRWAVVRAILTFHKCEGQSHKTVSTDHNFGSERRAEADSNRGPSAYQPTALPPGQTAHTLYPPSTKPVFKTSRGAVRGVT